MRAGMPALHSRCGRESPSIPGRAKDRFPEGTSMADNSWPSLPLEEWADTYATLHMWTQVVGKVRLALTPLINHWWNVPLYVTASGLTTSPMPYKDRTFQIDFDFIEHQ